MVTYPATPVLIDKFIVDFNTKIVTSLTWLNNPLGQIQKVTKKIGSRHVNVPAMHDDSGEYIEVFPSDSLVNFSWWVFEPIEIGNRLKAKIKARAAFNMFINLNVIYPSVTASRDLENVKSQVYSALSNVSILSGALRINNMSDRIEDVYKGFKLTDTDDKYFMQPYAGLSFDLDIYLRNNVCGV